ncbi:hypothetical protein K432DRAFT_216956 [Lepidopterella palustris CBS 459.81]|uniref:Uncharacterized protein n=1 Tax=Lepidopterella palustris CBS 459.81 TaxID=1314670 RepID=A0A8E2JKK8_9PEZI|nr:hypothetical protein K432DRAFT_216956 [Lepidopterella palustris CBS 459.81]
MPSGAPIKMASVLQLANIKKHSSVAHNINLSTAASEKQPVHLSDHIDPDANSDIGEDEIPISVLNLVPQGTPCLLSPTYASNKATSRASRKPRLRRAYYR